jgi:hypothetical protein
MLGTVLHIVLATFHCQFKMTSALRHHCALSKWMYKACMPVEMSVLKSVPVQPLQLYAQVPHQQTHPRRLWVGVL